MQLNKMFEDFNKLYGVESIPMNQEHMEDTGSLVMDEVTEFIAEAREGNIINGAKELTDILYITMQRMVAHGLNPEALLAEVHRSNMSKRVHRNALENEMLIALQRYPAAEAKHLRDDWFVLKDKTTGKVIKPQYYLPADIPDVLNQTSSAS